MFCEESLGKNNKCDFRAFPELQSVHEFYHLKEFLITLEQVNPSLVEKNKEQEEFFFINLNKQRL